MDSDRALGFSPSGSSALSNARPFDPTVSSGSGFDQPCVARAQVGGGFCGQRGQVGNKGMRMRSSQRGRETAVACVKIPNCLRLNWGHYVVVILIVEVGLGSLDQKL